MAIVNLTRPNSTAENAQPIISTYALWGTSGRGYAEFEIADYTSADQLREALNGYSVEIQDSTYNVDFFNGEPRFYQRAVRGRRVHECLPYTNKLFAPCDIDPVKLKLEIMNRDIHVVEDKYISLTTNQYADYAATMKKSSIDTIVAPISTFTTSPDPLDLGPTRSDTSFSIPFMIAVDDDNYVFVQEADDYSVVITHRFSYVSGTAVDEMKYRYRLLFDGTGNWSGVVDWPDMEIYNDTDAAYEVIRDFEEDIVGRSNDNYQPFNETIDIVAHAASQSNDISEYINEISTDDDFTLCSVQIRISPGNMDTAVQMYLYLSELTMKVDTAQFMNSGLHQIASNTSNTLTFESGVNLPTWVTHDITHEGLNLRDVLYVTKYVDDIIADIFNTADIPFTLDWNVTDSDKVADIVDVTNISVFSTLQRYCDLLNAVWWNDMGTTSIKGRSLDNLASSGVTLTEDDVIPGTMSHVVSSENIKTKIRAVGAEDISYEVTTTPEYTPKLGNEYEVYRDPTIVSNKQIQDLANSKLFLHEKAIKEVRATLNYSNPPQSYANLEVGDTVEFSFLDEFDYTSTGDGILFIQSMELVNNAETDNQDYVTLTMQRRYN